MYKSATPNLWIEAGYELFAYEGPESIQIEKIAKLLGRNKSGFYHHFGDRDLFIHELIQHHYRVSDQFSQEASALRNFNPDFLNLLIRYRTAYFIQSQLRKRMDIPFYLEAFTKVREQTEKQALPLWGVYLNLSDSQDLALELWFIIRDLFFMRLNSKNMNLVVMQKIVDDFVKTINILRHKNQA